MRYLFLLVLALGIAACGEREQTVDASKRTYQGKRDTLPWDNEPAAAELRGGTWQKGERASWEDQIKARQLAQHEHRRIYQ